MSIFTVGGSAYSPTGLFAWTGTYNDQGNGTVTITATGPSVGRGLALVRQEDGRMAAIYFVQNGGGDRFPLPEGTVVAVERNHAINGPATVISPARLNPFPPNPDKPGDVGGFESVTYWTNF